MSIDPLTLARYRAARNSDHAPPAAVAWTWAVFDPYDDALRLFATETEAVDYANDRTTLYSLDETWDENVEGLAVVRIVRPVEQHVIARNSDPASAEWHRAQLEALAAWRDAEVDDATAVLVERILADLIPQMLGNRETQAP